MVIKLIIFILRLQCVRIQYFTVSPAFDFFCVVMIIFFYLRSMLVSSTLQVYPLLIPIIILEISLKLHIAELQKFFRIEKNFQGIS